MLFWGSKTKKSLCKCVFGRCQSPYCMPLGPFFKIVITSLFFFNVSCVIDASKLNIVSFIRIFETDRIFSFGDVAWHACFREIQLAIFSFFFFLTFNFSHSFTSHISASKKTQFKMITPKNCYFLFNFSHPISVVSII